MQIFSHILPGNTEMQAIADKHTVTVKLGNESPTAILFDCNSPFALDTCAEVRKKKREGFVVPYGMDLLLEPYGFATI